MRLLQRRLFMNGAAPKVAEDAAEAENLVAPRILDDRKRLELVERSVELLSLLWREVVRKEPGSRDAMEVGSRSVVLGAKWVVGCVSAAVWLTCIASARRAPPRRRSG